MRLRNLGQKFTGLLKQGLSPKELALSISVAVLIGVFPIYGITTFILAFLALKMRLNMPIMLALSYILTPVQILLIIPFARIGELLLGIESLGMDLETLQSAYAEGFLVVVSKYSGRLILAIGSWILIAVPVAVFLYILLFQIFRAIKSSRKRLENKMSSEIK